MNFYEKTMREFLQNDNLLQKKVFHDKVVVGALNNTTNVKISFHNFGLADNYHGFLVQIINKERGIVDSQTFRFNCIVGREQTQKERTSPTPHLWEYNGDVTWAGGTFTDDEKQEIMSFVQKYLFLYV